MTSLAGCPGAVRKRRGRTTIQAPAGAGATERLEIAVTDAETLSDALVEVPVEYADWAVEWLADHETTTADSVGLGGFSRGGELALLVGTRHENVGGVVNWSERGCRSTRSCSPKS